MNLITEIREYAADHYYRWSMDVVATHWSDDEIAAAITGANTRRGAIAKVWAIVKHIDAVRDTFEACEKYGPRPVRPVSLFEFLGNRGGLRPCADLQVILDGNPMVAGGPLLRRNGLTLDHAREIAVEADYLQSLNYNDLLTLIEKEARGEKQYAYGQWPANVTFTDEELSDDCPF